MLTYFNLALYQVIRSFQYLLKEKSCFKSIVNRFQEFFKILIDFATISYLLKPIEDLRCWSLQEETFAFLMDWKEHCPWLGSRLEICLQCNFHLSLSQTFVWLALQMHCNERGVLLKFDQKACPHHRCMIPFRNQFLEYTH